MSKILKILRIVLLVLLVADILSRIPAIIIENYGDISILAFINTVHTHKDMGRYTALGSLVIAFANTCILAYVHMKNKSWHKGFFIVSSILIIIGLIVPPLLALCALIIVIVNVCILIYALIKRRICDVFTAALANLELFMALLCLMWPLIVNYSV